MALMRHESIETTMRYYVGRNANTTADAVWKAYEEAKKVLFWVLLGKTFKRSALRRKTQIAMLTRA